MSVEERSTFFVKSPSPEAADSYTVVPVTYAVAPATALVPILGVGFNVYVIFGAIVLPLAGTFRARYTKSVRI